MGMAGISLTTEQVAQGITLVATKAYRTPLIDQMIDQNDKPFIMGVYNLDPDPAKQGETLEGPTSLFDCETMQEWGMEEMVEVPPNLPAGQRPAPEVKVLSVLAVPAGSAAPAAS